MSRTAFQLIFFNIAINISITLLLLFFPVFTQFNVDKTLKYSTFAEMNFPNEINKSITPGNQISQNSGFFSSILDAMGVGYLVNFLQIMGKFISGSLFGLAELIISLAAAFGMSGAQLNALSTTFYIIQTVIYLIAVLWLFSGRNTTKESI